jgi:Cu/Zn superoxide dismutase
MSIVKHKRLRVTAAMVAAGAITVAGATLATSWAAVAQASPARPAAVLISDRGVIADSHAGEMKFQLNLSAMPAGTITTGTTAAGQQFVEVTVYGLTPGSAHEVTLHTKPIGTLTADATGQATQTFDVPGIALFDRVRILDGGAGTHVIAVSSATELESGPYSLHAVEAGFPAGTMHGKATLVYDPAKATISVTLSAWGVSPGMHAAHIHLGSCASQGGVKYMMMDFKASRRGQISHETRVVTGVTTAPPATGWYLNLHQGTSNNILSGGNPTINFRPLLCANI